MAEERKGGGKSGGGDELDDWAAAIDEWDANLAFPSASEKAKNEAAKSEAAKSEAAASEDPKTRDRSATPAVGVPELRRARDPSQPIDVPAPLEAAPLPDAAPEEDPLMHLFDGEMELPEEAGQALGTLLGDAVKEPATGEEPVGKLDLDAESPSEPGLYAEESESTRVADADEFDKLLADTAAIADQGSAPKPMPEASDAAKSEDPSLPSIDIASDPGFGAESTRVAAAAEVDQLLADADEVEKDLPAPPPSGVFKAPTLPEPGSKLKLTPSGRFQTESGRYQTPSGRFEAQKPPAELDLEVEMELGAAVEQAVSAPPPVDEDFYDDIVVEAAREQPIERPAVPPPSPPPSPPAAMAAAAAPARAADDDQDLFEVTVDAEDNVTQVSAPASRLSDPDRTPLPIADGDDEPVGAQPLRVMQLGESRPVVGTRVAVPLAELTASLPTLTIVDVAPPRALDTAYLRDQLALYDTERLLSPADQPARVAQLAFAAGRVAEKLGDVGGALERYEAALEAEPKHAHALRGLRRLRLADGKREPVVGLLEREIAEASPAEKRGLYAMRGELALALGDREVARASYEAILKEQADDLGALSGLVDLAASGGDDGRAQAIGNLYEAVGSGDAPMRAALIVERARLDEAAGRVREAVAHYREALGHDPSGATAMAAAWGLMRVAVRTPGLADDVETHSRLAELLPAGALRQALERRLGLVKARAGDVAGARPALQAAAADGDRVALADLAELERADGRLDEAAALLARVIDAELDAGRRADRLIALGELAEKLGRVGDAAAAYQRADEEYPDDPRAARALERTQAAGGGKEAALMRHLQAAERSPARAPMELTYAARLLRELGRSDEALARLDMALTAAPALGPAIDLAVELQLAAGRADEAAAVLGRAADALSKDGEAGLAQHLRMRGARMLLRAGRAGDALAMVRPLTQASEVPRAARWLEERILRAAEGQSDALVAALRAEADAAESAGDKPRVAALAYERALVSAGDDDAIDAWRRVLAIDPGHGAALVEIAARASAERRAAELPSLLQARLDAAGTRPEAIAVALRLGAALLEDARDAAAAARVYADAATRAPGYAPAREGLDRVAHAGDDPAAHLAALERERADAESPEQRFAIDLVLGERLEREGHPDKAAERYRHALESRPTHPLARHALERALQAAKQYSALADLALGDLKEAPDPQAKVAAYERLAFLDGDLRGDPNAALLGWESILEVDHAHHVAMRVLEKHYLGDQRWPELVALYEQMGLGATDAAFAVAVHLDRARLRRRLAAGSENNQAVSEAELAVAVDNDYRLALFKDRRCRSALRHVYARARTGHDLAQEADAAGALAEATPDDARTAAVMLTRAAEALIELERPDDARARYEAAVERLPSHAPALIGLCDFALAQGDWARASHAAERAGQALRDNAAKARYLLVAGALAQDRLDDPEEKINRAQSLFRAALAAEPRSPEAFSRLERSLHDTRDFAALADLYARRLETENDATKKMALRLMLARIARDELKDRERARVELKSVLMQDPTHPEALAALADLQFEDGQWADAAETLIRRARAEKSRTALKDIFFKLGLIYSEHLPDPKRAVASFTRVLQVTPDDIVALEQLSNLHVKEWEWKGALQATMRLAGLEPVPHKRVAHLHRVAKIYEEGFKDARHALAALRDALEIDPLYLPSIGELAKFFDRQSDVQSMRVHLDRTSARIRQQLDANPMDPVSYHSLFKIFGWRRAPDRAAFAAGTLEWLGAADADEKTMLGRLTGRDNYPGSSLGDPTLDETLFDARVPAGFRNLFRLLDEPLAKMFRADVKRLGVGRHEKLPRSGHALRDVANKVAADLGIRDFDLYVTAAHPTALVVELTDPLSIVIGNKVIEGAHELELRFLVGRCFKMIQSHMALPMRLTPEDLGLLVGGIVRQFVPDFVPAGFEEAQVVAEAGRMSRIIPKKLHGELLPFALECASESLDLKQIGPSLVHTANRAGLLCCGLPGPSLTAVRRLGDEAQLRALLRFTVSDELAELRRQLGTALG
ncbi:MAG TPA: tetratricopeptide repeat protein [Polyangia bacterium]